jgi:hypothetical protein
VRLLLVQACCAVAEGADVPLSRAVADDASAAADMCVAAVLGDALRRVSVLGGREGMPRSLGSVYGGSITRFLGGLRGVVSDVVKTPGIVPWSNGIAVSHDGSTLLLSDTYGESHAVLALTRATARWSPSLAAGAHSRGTLSHRRSSLWRPTAPCSSRTVATTACRC